MRQRGKKIPTLDEILSKMGTSREELYSLKYKKSLEAARASKAEEETIAKLKIRTGYYSMRTRVKNNPWIKQRPASKAYQWLYKTVFKDSTTYRYTRRLMYQGGMFAFEYKSPKYKGTSVLPWFDKYPLVISLGPVVTKLGIRNIGFNMHLLPPKIRIIVMCAIFELHKKMYRYQIFMKQDKPVTIDYRLIVNNLERYGVGFCVRMYIPNRMNQIIRFPYKDWHKAIFIPSRGYDSIRAAQLIKEWRAYNKKHGHNISPNIDWKAHV
jgi:hypothetical protein